MLQIDRRLSSHDQGGWSSSPRPTRFSTPDNISSDLLARRSHSQRLQTRSPHIPRTQTPLSRSASWTPVHTSHHAGRSMPRHTHPSAHVNKQIITNTSLKPLTSIPEIGVVQRSPSKTKRPPLPLHKVALTNSLAGKHHPHQHIRCDDDVPLAVLAYRQGSATPTKNSQPPAAPRPRRRSGALHHPPGSTSSKNTAVQENHDRHSRHTLRPPLMAHVTTPITSPHKPRRSVVRPTAKADVVPSNKDDATKTTIKKKTGFLARVKRLLGLQWFTKKSAPDANEERMDSTRE